MFLYIVLLLVIIILVENKLTNRSDFWLATQIYTLSIESVYRCTRSVLGLGPGHFLSRGLLIGNVEYQLKTQPLNAMCCFKCYTFIMFSLHQYLTLSLPILRV